MTLPYKTTPDGFPVWSANVNADQANTAFSTVLSSRMMDGYGRLEWEAAIESVFPDQVGSWEQSIQEILLDPIERRLAAILSEVDQIEARKNSGQITVGEGVALLTTLLVEQRTLVAVRDGRYAAAYGVAL